MFRVAIAHFAWICTEPTVGRLTEVPRLEQVLFFSPMVNCNWVCQCHFCTASELLLLLSIGMTPVDSRLNHEEPVRCEPDRDESEHPFSVR